MIRINNRFSAERDGNGWTLIERIPGKSKDGEPITRERKRYYPDMRSMVSAMMDLAPEGARTMREMAESIEAFKRDLLKVVNEGSVTLQENAERNQ